MERRIKISGEVYSLKFYINGWEEGEAYFKDTGRFGESEMELMTSGETIKKNGNTFRIRYEDEYGHLHTVEDVLNNNV